MTIHKAAAIIIQNKKLLVERSPGRGKHVLIAPGGKLQHGELHKTALIRELEEEFGIVVALRDLSFFSEDAAEAANHPGSTIIMKTYIVHKWRGTITPKSEVEEIAWVQTSDISKLPIGSIFTQSIMPELKKRDMID